MPCIACRFSSAWLRTIPASALGLQWRASGSDARREHGHWSSLANQRAFMDTVAEKAGVQVPEQWRTVGTAMVKQLGGAGLLDRYGGSVARLLEACYPEVEWKPWHLRQRFGKAHWTLPENRRAFLHQLAAEFSIERPEDWKRVSSEDIRARGGAPLLSRKGPTLCSHLSEAFPGQEFDEVLCRPRVSQQHWECPGARRRFMETLAGDLGLEGPEGWAAVSREDISSRGGSGLLALYDNSVFRLLEDIFPEVMGGAGSERKLPQGFWDSEATRLHFIADIAERYGVKTAGDWRRVTTAMVVREGGAGLIQRYPSLAAAIGDLWKPQHGSDEVMDVFDCRKVVPAEFWKEEANVRKVIHTVAAELHLTSPGDWARVSHAQLRDQNAFGLLRHMSLLDALRIAYPDTQWSERDLERAGGRRAVQRHLAVQVQRLLPVTTVLEDHQHVLKRHSSRAVELDIFLPAHNLALEYNGEHHYAEIPFFGPLEVIQRRDAEKRRLCKEGGIRLLEVPYWWDRSLPSLAATIHSQFPSLLHGPGAP